MPGGDFKQFNERLIKIESDYRNLPCAPMAVDSSRVVNDMARRESHKSSKELHQKVFKQYNDFISKATALKNDINDHLDELQSSNRGGKLEQWRGKVSKIDNMISDCKKRSRNDEKYL